MNKITGLSGLVIFIRGNLLVYNSDCRMLLDGRVKQLQIRRRSGTCHNLMITLLMFTQHTD